VGEVKNEGWLVGNCDLTVIAEEPRLQPHRERIRSRVAQLLGVAPGAVGVKATTHEGLGALGRGEGVAALAVVLLRRA
jgi:2-C-methyl-D-erythritol 2,4-cyclodiphosphate synthase